MYTNIFINLRMNNILLNNVRFILHIFSCTFESKNIIYLIYLNFVTDMCVMLIKNEYIFYNFITLPMFTYAFVYDFTPNKDIF